MKTATGTTLVTNGQLIGGTGQPPVRDGALVITDGRITYAGPVTSLTASTWNAKVEVRRVRAMLDRPG